MIDNNRHFVTPSVPLRSTLFFALFSLFLLSSCRVKSGCPTDQYRTKIGKNGSASTKRGNTNLFPKDMRRKLNLN